jgi:hypothetical protein
MTSMWSRPLTSWVRRPDGEGYYHGLTDREDLRRYPRSAAETEALFATHPDLGDAPEPDPARNADADTGDDAALETESDEQF